MYNVTHTRPAHESETRVNFPVLYNGVVVAGTGYRRTLVVRLQHAAGAAAHSGDLQMQVSVPGRDMHAIPFWDELRTWDPGD